MSKNLANAQKAWKMNQVIMGMNNEYAYYESGWLYIWPDESTYEDCVEYFSEEEDFQELKKAYLEIFEHYLDDGFYKLATQGPDAVEFAKETLVELGIEGELKETQPNLWEVVYDDKLTEKFVVWYGDDPRDLRKTGKYKSEESAEKRADNLRAAYTIVQVLEESKTLTEEETKEVSLFELSLKPGTKFKVHKDVFYCDVEQEGIFVDSPELVDEYTKAGFILKGTELYIPSDSVLTFEMSQSVDVYSLNGFRFDVAEWSEDKPMSITILSEEMRQLNEEDESISELEDKFYDAGVDFMIADDEGKDFIILYDWKDVRKAQEVINPDFTPKDEYDTSEIDRFNWGFADEWSRCDNCNALIRTEPDSYSFKADFWYSEDHGLICGDCIRDEAEFTEAYIDFLVNNPKAANTILEDSDLEDYGFREMEEDEFESGWYGRADSPEEILENALAEQPEGRFIFSITGVGQFATRFTLWGDESSLYEPELDDEDENLEEDVKTTNKYPHLQAVIDELNAPYVFKDEEGEFEVESLFNFYIVEEEDSIFVIDRNHVYTLYYEETSNIILKDAEDEFGVKIPYQEDDIQTRFDKALRKEEGFADDAYFEWEDSSRMVAYKYDAEKDFYEVQYWIDEESREEGLSDWLLDEFKDLEKAKDVARDLVNGEGYASAEVIDSRGNTVFGVDAQGTWGPDGHHKEFTEEVKEEEDTKEWGVKQLVDYKTYKHNPQLVIGFVSINLTKEEAEAKAEEFRERVNHTPELRYEVAKVTEADKEKFHKTFSNEKTEVLEIKEDTKEVTYVFPDSILNLFGEFEKLCDENKVTIISKEKGITVKGDLENIKKVANTIKHDMSETEDIKEDRYDSKTHKFKVVFGDDEDYLDTTYFSTKEEAEDYAYQKFSSGYEIVEIRDIEADKVIKLTEDTETKSNSAFTKEEAENHAKKLTQLLFDEGKYYDVWSNNQTLEAQIEWGDWKHDHLYFKAFTLKYFEELEINVDIDSEVTESDESDVYSALYTIKKK